MKKVSSIAKVKVLKEDKGYSAFTHLNDDLITTEAETFDELKENILKAINLYLEDKSEVISLQDIQFEYDLESFFEFYRVINAKALSERIGMNQSLLSQYIKGIKKPSKSQMKRILDGVQQIGKELSDASFIT